MKRAAVLRVLLALACAAVQPVAAQEPQVRAHLAADASPWVGQQVTLVVELLAPGYFAGAVNFDLPDPSGVLLMPPAGSPLLGNEAIGDTLYTVQRHELRAWAMRPGEQVIPAFGVRFSFKRNPLDTQAVAASMTTSPVTLTARTPPGADPHQLVISARELVLEEQWDPQPADGAVMAGSAFTRRVTFSAPDVPGMLFPPFPAGGIDGLGVYRKQQLLDSDERGELVGKRRDTITYMLQRPGEFSVPAVSFSWYDLDANKLRTPTLPARRFTVIANPAMASAAEASGAPAHRGWFYYTFAVLAALAVMLRLGRSARVRECLARRLAPLRPVHLQPLNPTDRSP